MRCCSLSVLLFMVVLYEDATFAEQGELHLIMTLATSKRRTALIFVFLLKCFRLANL